MTGAISTKRQLSDDHCKGSAEVTFVVRVCGRFDGFQFLHPVEEMENAFAESSSLGSHRCCKIRLGFWRFLSLYASLIVSFNELASNS